MEETQAALPERLQLSEEGEWYRPTWGQTSDDDQWIWTGWRARDSSGNVFFRHKDESEVKSWLAQRGYQDTGDGRHYRRLTVLTPAERDEMARQHQHEENARILRLTSEEDE